MNKLLSKRLVKASQCNPTSVVGSRFIVTRKPSKSRQPNERSFDDPTAWEEYEAALGLGQLGDLQVDAVRLGFGSRFLAGVALVYVS